MRADAASPASRARAGAERGAERGEARRGERWVSWRRSGGWRAPRGVASGGTQETGEVLPPVETSGGGPSGSKRQPTQHAWHAHDNTWGRKISLDGSQTLKSSQKGPTKAQNKVQKWGQKRPHTCQT